MKHGWTILIAAHAIAASYALIFGAINLLRNPKGDRPHRIIGALWLVAMYFVIISSFFIQSLRPGSFSWIHGLSVFTFFTISIGLYAAIRHNIKAHRAYMTGSYFGLLGALAGVVTVPSRLIPQMAMQETIQFTSIVLFIVLSAGFAAYASILLLRSRSPER